MAQIDFRRPAFGLVAAMAMASTTATIGIAQPGGGELDPCRYDVAWSPLPWTYFSPTPCFGCEIWIECRMGSDACIAGHVYDRCGGPVPVSWPCRTFNGGTCVGGVCVRDASTVLDSIPAHQTSFTVFLVVDVRFCGGWE